jgi:hypothetical protein
MHAHCKANATEVNLATEMGVVLHGFQKTAENGQIASQWTPGTFNAYVKPGPVTNGPERPTGANEIAAQRLDGLRRFRFEGLLFQPPKSRVGLCWSSPSLTRGMAFSENVAATP